MDTPSARRTRIMSPEQVRRTLRRLAYEVVERNRGAADVQLFGVLQSGAPLARAIAEEIGVIEDAEIPVHDLNVGPYRDDRDTPSPPDTPPANVDVTDQDVILVDDVLFTGRTARAALDAIIQFGRPRSIQLMVLVDRGHREYPIRPDYVGRALQTKHQEQVEVALDEAFAVYVTE